MASANFVNRKNVHPQNFLLWRETRNAQNSFCALSKYIFIYICYVLFIYIIYIFKYILNICFGIVLCSWGPFSFMNRIVIWYLETRIWKESIVEAIFDFFYNETEFNLVQNRKENGILEQKIDLKTVTTMVTVFGSISSRVFLSILNLMEFCFIIGKFENCFLRSFPFKSFSPILFNLKRIGKKILSVDDIF